MNLAVLTISDDFLAGRSVADQSIHFLSKKLIEEGFAIVSNTIVPSDTETISRTVEFIKNNANHCFVLGNTAAFKAYLTSISIEAEKVAVLDGVNFIIIKESSKQEFDYFLPLFKESKILYETVIFKTFGITESDIRSTIKDYLKNKSRIIITLYPSLLECEVRIRYSSKMAKMAVDEIIEGVRERLKTHIYAVGDISLPQRAAELLLTSGNTLAISESFTGGGLAAEIVKITGASRYFLEGIVSYSNTSKVKTLNIDPNIINNFGAVSAETAYEMAAFMQSKYPASINIATTGNAGPTAEKTGDEGVCFIAVGDQNAIEVYSFCFNGQRGENIECGIKSALFLLIKKLLKF